MGQLKLENSYRFSWMCSSYGHAMSILRYMTGQVFQSYGTKSGKKRTLRPDVRRMALIFSVSTVSLRYSLFPYAIEFMSVSVGPVEVIVNGKDDVCSLPVEPR